MVDTNKIKVTILESIILEIKHYYYPELSRNEESDKDIRVILTKTDDDAKEVQLHFKYLFAISKTDEKYKILLNLYMKAYEYISKHFAEFVNSELIQFNDERLIIYLDESLIKDSNIPMPYFGLLHEFDLIKLNIDQFEKDDQLIKNELSENSFEIPFEFEFDIETKPYFEDSLDEKKRLENIYQNHVESMLEAKYDMFNELNSKNVNSGIVNDEIINDISNIDKYVLVDLTYFDHLQIFAKMSKININELIKENVTNIIYNVKDDKIMFKYINYELMIKNISEL